MSKLHLYNVEPIDDLVSPEDHEDITLRSPATLVFTDFKQVNPLVIESDTTALEAESLMQKSHVRLKIVVDSQNQFLGIVSLDNLHNQEIVKKIANGVSRENLLVTDFMIPKISLMAFDFDELGNANIGDLISALKGSGQQHCLAVDRNEHNIRGVISASDIARSMMLPIDIGTSANFNNIFNVVHNCIDPLD